MKIGLALSGGGIRGVAHIGAIKALQENGIEGDIIAGTSAGSIVGSMYAAGISTNDMMKFVRESGYTKIFRFGVPFLGLTSLSFLKESLSKMIKEDSFEALEKPFYVAISNLNTGNVEIVNTGKLFDVVTASCSIPLIFKPIEINGHLYVDGGLLDNMPAKSLRPLCDIVIGVNVHPKVGVETKELRSMMSIMMRVFMLSIDRTTAASSKYCDIVVTPYKLHAFNPFNLKKAEDIYKIGYDAMMEKMPEIKTLVGR